MNKNDRKRTDDAINSAQGIGTELESIRSELEAIALDARESNGTLDQEDNTPLTDGQNTAALALVKKAVDLSTVLDAAHTELAELSEAEQEKFDNLNEGLQASERGQALETNAGNLDEVASSVEDAGSTLSDVDVPDDAVLDATKLDEIAEAIGEVVSTLESLSFDAE